MPSPSPVANSFRGKSGEKRTGGTSLSRALGAVDGFHQNNVTELSFPGDIEQLDHWCAVRIFSQKLMRRKDAEITEDIARVFLPMPQQLQTAYNHGYNAESLGPIGAAAAVVGGDAREGGISSVMDRITGMGKEDAKTAAASAASYLAQAAGAGGGVLVSSALGSKVGSVVGAGLGPAVKGAMGGAGIARNPFMALLYDAPAMREHQFSWKLIARNYAESNNIYNIIKLFKYHAAPGRTVGGLSGDIDGQSVFLTYPEQFDIDFHHKELLYNIAPSVLKGFTVNYHPDGTQYHTSPDGTAKAPVAVQIDMQLQEVAIVTKENIKAFDR
jgi:hypothetical protein